MHQSEAEYLQELRDWAAKTHAFLRSHTDTELAICRAFLRTLGVAFRETELIKHKQGDPVDVEFRQGRFQIKVYIKDDFTTARKRDGDWKEKVKKYNDAASLDELLKPFTPRTPIELATVFPEIAKALVRPATKKYGKGCEKLDALVYVDLADYYLVPNSKIPEDLTALTSQGWRSVSFLFVPYGIVLFANSTAPEFLRTNQRCQKAEWKGLATSSLFEI